MRSISIIFFVGLTYQAGLNITQVRDAYFQSITNKRFAEKFEKMLESVHENGVPIMVCYKGAAEMLKAKYAFNPLNKYAHFNSGRRLIDLAIGRDSACVECRFIRFTIQQNLPGILNYNSDIHKDSVVLATRSNNLMDPDLKVRITSYLKRTNCGN